MINLILSSGKGRLFINESASVLASPMGAVQGDVHFELYEPFHMESWTVKGIGWLPEDGDGQTYRISIGGLHGSMSRNINAETGGPDFIGSFGGEGVFEIVAWKRDPFAHLKAHLEVHIGPRRKPESAERYALVI